MKLAEAQALIGRHVRYVKKGGTRFGWEGVITEANTVRFTVIYDNGVEQDYDMEALIPEGKYPTNVKYGRWPYIMVLSDHVKPQPEVTPEEDEEWGRKDQQLNAYHELAKEYEGVEYESAADKIIPTFNQGRHIEKLGKLLQDPRSNIGMLTETAARAGLSLRFTIQPKVES